NITLDLPPGRMVALVGRSGCGKTTLMKLIACLFEPTEGTIFFDNVDLKTLNYRDVRRHIGTVLQENHIFNETIARNISFGDPELFFFQAEDGIRDGHVTGVQTCALPISAPRTAPLSLTLVPQGALGIAAVPETGTSFLANALLKARHAAQCAALPALADDSGLEVEALGGRPGVRSARFAGEGASDDDNLRRLLEELREVPQPQ